MARLVDNGFAVCVQQEVISPRGAYRVSVYRDLEKPKESTKRREWKSIPIAALDELDAALERVADELGVNSRR